MTFGYSSKRTSLKLLGVSLGWITGQQKNNWTSSVAGRPGCLFMLWQQSNSLITRITLPRSNWILFSGHQRALCMKGGPGSGKMQLLIYCTLQFSRRPSVMIMIQKITRKSAPSLVLWFSLQVHFLHPQLQCYWASVLKVYSSSCHQFTHSSSKSRCSTLPQVIF